MKKKIFSLLADELREVYPELDSVSEYKLIQALESLKDIQKSSLPDARFKSKLQEKLQTLSKLDSENVQKYQSGSFFSRLSLLGGIFASILFVSAFFYILKDTFLQENISVKKVGEIQIQEDISLGEDTSKTLDVSQNQKNTIQDGISDIKILKETDVIFPTGSSKGVPKKTQKESVVGDTFSPPTNPISDTIMDTSSIFSSQKIVDDTPQDTQNSEVSPPLEVPELVSGENTSLGEGVLRKTADTPPDTDTQDSLGDTSDMMSDTMMMDMTVPVAAYTFENFCTDSKGTLSGKLGHQLCKKDKKTCSETEYYNGTCHLEEYDETDTEIFLEELINEIQK